MGIRGEVLLFRIPLQNAVRIDVTFKNSSKLTEKNGIEQTTYSFSSKNEATSGISWSGSAWGSLQQPGAARDNIETGQALSSVEIRQMSQQQQSSVLSQQQTSVLSQQNTSILSQQKTRQLPASGRLL